MKNIVIGTGSLLMGGIERVLQEVLKNLDKNKYKIFLFVEKDYGKSNIFLDEIPKEVEVYFLKPYSLIEKAEYYRDKKKNIFYKLLYNIQMKKERKIGNKSLFLYLKEIEEKYGKIDTFIDFNCGQNKIIKKINIPNKLAWIHISMPKLLKSKNKLFRFGLKLKGYDKVVTICDEMAEEMKKLYPYLKEKIVRIYNPFDFERITYLSNDNLSLIPKEKELIKENYILAVSRLALEQKDYYTLIKGYKKALEKGIREKLYIIGDGSDREKIEKMIQDEELENKIFLLGEKKNPYIWMKNSKLFVHSSFYEGFGLVLVEAMICGKVVLSSDCPVGPKEILTKDSCGVLFKTSNIDDLSEKLESLLLKENLEVYQERIKNRIKEFSTEEIMKEYEKII
ncbi:glycosyltransferase [Fusobacterium perfoetens]|uniref:glycosyltransferase n=1 Tax=Fusobacterium perfoetens TaxID=852 RepID=UPI000487E221|nr:glycosyltransferase [Fusobacterium perfoetens]